MRAFVRFGIGLVLLVGISASAAERPAGPALQAADAALKSGKHAEAIQLASQILATNSQEARAFFLRGRAYETAHEYPKALADYNAGIKINPKVPFAYQSRGTVFFRLGKFAESVADFDKFLESNQEQA